MANRQRARRYFSPEFKAETVELVKTSGKSIPDICRELDLTETTVRNWVRQAAVDAGERGRRHDRRARGAAPSASGEQDAADGAGPVEKSGGLLRQGLRPDPVKVFAFIEAEKACFPISFMCSRLGVSKSGFYAWRDRPLSDRAIADGELTETITKIHAESRGTYGAPRIHAELRLDYDVRCGRKRVARLMRTAGLEGVHRRRRQGLTRRDPNGETSDDLVERRFKPVEPNRLWVADITQQRCWDGWLYIAVVIDAFSRRVIGWSMADHIRTELVLDALNMAVAHRKPATEVVHHSDHSCQYTSLAFGRRLREVGLARSMGSVGDCFDNAVAESFFATLECELLDRRSWPTRRELQTAVFDFIEGFYNPRRRHSTLGYLSPANYEAVHAAGLHPAA